ncbi:hypothetical protein I7I48_02455 [Histoplasma ohiense]|nr:hypothetical protein I7I48_02455 [Histoplasma ohiense (nom. inval.)]
MVSPSLTINIRRSRLLFPFHLFTSCFKKQNKIQKRQAGSCVKILTSIHVFVMETTPHRHHG